MSVLLVGGCICKRVVVAFVCRRLCVFSVGLFCGSSSTRNVREVRRERMREGVSPAELRPWFIKETCAKSMRGEVPEPIWEVRELCVSMGRAAKGSPKAAFRRRTHLLKPPGLLLGRLHVLGELLPGIFQRVASLACNSRRGHSCLKTAASHPLDPNST